MRDRRLAARTVARDEIVGRSFTSLDAGIDGVLGRGRSCFDEMDCGDERNAPTLRWETSRARTREGSVMAKRKPESPASGSVPRSGKFDPRALDRTTIAIPLLNEIK